MLFNEDGADVCLKMSVNWTGLVPFNMEMSAFGSVRSQLYLPLHVTTAVMNDTPQRTKDCVRAALITTLASASLRLGGQCSSFRRLFT